MSKTYWVKSLTFLAQSRNIPKSTPPGFIIYITASYCVIHSWISSLLGYTHICSLQGIDLFARCVLGAPLLSIMHKFYSVCVCASNNRWCPRFLFHLTVISKCECLKLFGWIRLSVLEILGPPPDHFSLQKDTTAGSDSMLLFSNPGYCLWFMS